jgi:hypothetical protein
VFIKYSLWLAYTFIHPHRSNLLHPWLHQLLYFYRALHDLNARSYLAREDVANLTIWSFILVFALASTYSMTAYDVDDNKQYMRHRIVAVLRLFSGVMRERFWPYFIMWLSTLMLLLYMQSIPSACAGLAANSYSDLYLQNHMKNI